MKQPDSLSLPRLPLEAPPETPPYPIGVIIPTYNRIDDLLVCLRHLETQTWKNFEVLIVDDGSTDNTRQEIERYRSTSTFPLRYLHQTNSGPATARNLAVAHLNSEICILIGDDIFPTPEFVATHLRFHQNHPQLTAVAVGLTRWSQQGQIVTPFMRWLDSDGVQFAYGELLQGTAPSWKHFYTSNLSLKSAYLRENKFHEGFRKAAMEDIELGYRLAAKHDLRMFFLPDAVAHHLHPTTFARACRRMIDVGDAAYLFGELWPEHRRSEPQNLIKRSLLHVFTEPHVVLPSLRKTTELLNRLWCPNPLLGQTLLFHERLGYRRRATEARDGTRVLQRQELHRGDSNPRPLLRATPEEPNEHYVNVRDERSNRGNETKEDRV